MVKRKFIPVAKSGGDDGIAAFFKAVVEPGKMNSTISLLLVFLNQFFMPRHNAQLRLLKAQITILRARIPIQSQPVQSRLLSKYSELQSRLRPAQQLTLLVGAMHFTRGPSQINADDNSALIQLVR
ncbi:hypothetical protein [Ruegeria marina]|uniref:hypothetical protein n=1 Tax=Ruegeria marina TaxID=639004 RepID=UPI000A645476|nr:hypothetical protein [Ruegeria marina]